MKLFKILDPFMEEADDAGAEVVQDAQEVVQDAEVVVDKPKEETVPLATLMEEKRKRKELERQLREVKEKEIESDVKLTKQSLKQKYIDKGFDEEVAESLADEFASLRSEVKKASFKELDNGGIDDDLKELAKDSFFSDAMTYKSEIQQTIAEYKKKGIDLDASDAYFKVRGKSRLKEYQTDIEQKALLNRQNAEEKKLPAATPKSPKDPYPLDDTDKKALEGLQKAQPNGGWTAEKFYKLMKG